MDVRVLRYFVTVAEERNFTKAAERLHMSQPPLSLQIRKLEEELDTKLFTRGSRQLTLTESGKVLYRRAIEALSLLDTTRSELRAIGEGMTGTISIGLVEGMPPDISTDWFAGFLNAYPDIQFRVFDGNSDDLFEKMRIGVIDLAVIISPCDNLMYNSFPVGDGKAAAFIDKSNPLADMEGTTISVSDLAKEKLIIPGRKSVERKYNRWFGAEEMQPKVICRMDSYLDAVALAQKTGAVGIFPRTTCKPYDSLVIKDIAGVDTQIEYVFVWRKGSSLPAIEERFIEFVKDYVDYREDC